MFPGTIALRCTAENLAKAHLKCVYQRALTQPGTVNFRIFYYHYRG